MLSLKQMVSNNRKVRFVFYRNQAMHYETETGFVFPVPLARAGNTRLGAEEKAIDLMAFINRQIKVVRLEQKARKIT